MINKAQKPTDRHGERVLLGVQGGYFAITGLWPIVHLKSFELVTGPKTDHWLVQTFGALILVIGVIFCISATSPQDRAGLPPLAVGCAVALAICDTIFVMNHVISAIYLADAVLELLLAAGWGCCLPHGES